MASWREKGFWGWSANRSVFDRLWGIDLRALAAMRIGLAAILLYDIGDRFVNLTAFHADSGILPREDLWRLEPNPYLWSLHTLSGSALWQGCLLSIAALAAMAFLVGWRTQLALAVTWALTISAQTRNPVILQGGDVLIRCLLFWSLFLPLGGRWSLDRLRATPDSDSPERILSPASLAILLQVAGMYLSSGFLKWDRSWTQTGEAIFFALNVDPFVTPLGRWLLESPQLMRPLTFATLCLERYGPLIAFFPWGTAWLRIGCVLAFWGLHLGLLLTMRLGHFPWVCFAAWLVFIPGMAWDRIEGLGAGVMRRIASQLQPLAGRLGTRRWNWPPRGRLVLDLAVTVWLVVAVLWNLKETRPNRFGRYWNPAWAPVLEIVRLDQWWGMFSPHPLLDDGWLMIEARLADGRVVDLFRGGAIASDDKPENLAELYAPERWRKYYLNLWLGQFAKAREPWCRWLVRGWESRHPEPESRVVTLDLFYWEEFTMLREPPRLRKVKLLNLVLVPEKAPWPPLPDRLGL